MHCFGCFVRQAPHPTQHHHRGMVAQLAVQRIELIARLRVHGDREPEVGSLPAGAHLHRRRIEVGRVAQDDFHHLLREAGLLASHDLDREAARILE